MKKIKNLQVTVKYTAGFENVEVPDDVYEGLMNGCLFDSESLNMSDEENAAMEWMADHISERDAMSWEYEVDDVQQEINMSEKEQIMDFIDQVLSDFTNEGAMEVLEDVKSEINMRIESCEEGTYKAISD